MFLLVQAFAELLLYETKNRFGGFQAVHRSVERVRVRRCFSDAKAITRVCEAVRLASCFFWKPVLCLPRAVVTTRLLRKRGVAATMVIGYRPSPFFSHAWVEVDGVIVNDSRAYQERLLVLEKV